MANIDKDERARIIEQAREQSRIETLQCVAYMGFFNILATYNRNSELKASISGGIRLPPAFLKNIAFAFDGNNLIVAFQEPTFIHIKNFTLIAGWVENDSNSICLAFSSFKYGPYRLQQIRLSIDVLLPSTMERIKKCKYVVLGCVNVIEGCYELVEVVNPPVEFLPHIPSGNARTKLGFEGLL